MLPFFCSYGYKVIKNTYFVIYEKIKIKLYQPFCKYDLSRFAKKLYYEISYQENRYIAI